MRPALVLSWMKALARSPCIRVQQILPLCLAMPLIVTSPLAARPALVALVACPKIYPDDCRVGAIEWTGPKSTKLIERRPTERKNITKVFLIQGRLNDGDVGPYALKFVQSLDDYFAHTHHSSAIAQLRRSSTEQPAVFTTRGLLEITTANVHPEKPPNTVLVNMKTWQAVGRYYDTYPDLARLQKKPSGMFWDEGGQRCRSADGQSTGARGCKPLRDDASHRRTPVKLSPYAIKRDRLISLVREVGEDHLQPHDRLSAKYGGNGVEVRVYRLPRTSFLVIERHCLDCQY